MQTLGEVALDRALCEPQLGSHLAHGAVVVVAQDDAGALPWGQRGERALYPATFSPPTAVRAALAAAAARPERAAHLLDCITGAG